jgi:probable phosphomutase (TIGR03848 family)
MNAFCATRMRTADGEERATGRDTPPPGEVSAFRRLRAVPTVLLVRHGRTEANVSGLLAGRTPGVRLDRRGHDQSRALAARLRNIPFAAVVSSPLERCLDTAAAILAGRDGLAVTVEDRLTECGYGEWTGRALKDLSRERLWKVVQSHPSAVTFPGGESLRAAQARAVDAIRERDAQVSADVGPNAVWIAVSHADVIKAVVADALGMHLDLFQRLVVDPCSVTAVRYTDGRPFVIRLNDTGDDLSAFHPGRRRRRRPAADATVGRGAGDAVGS